MGDRESYDTDWRSYMEAEMMRQMEIDLMWGKGFYLKRVFQPTLYQTHMRYLDQVLKLTGL